MNNKLSTPLAITLVAFLAVCVCAITGLTIAGKDAGALIYFLSGSAIPTVSIVFVGKRLDNIGSVVSEAKATAVDNNVKLDGVAHAVNGNLDAKLRAWELRLLERLAEPDSKS